MEPSVPAKSAGRGPGSSLRGPNDAPGSVSSWADMADRCHAEEPRSPRRRRLLGGCAGPSRRSAFPRPAAIHAGDSYDAPFHRLINESLAAKSFAGQTIGRLIFCGLESMKVMKMWSLWRYSPGWPAGASAPEIVMRRADPFRDSMTLVARNASESGRFARRAAEGAQISPRRPCASPRWRRLREERGGAIPRAAVRDLAAVLGLAWPRLWRDGYVWAACERDWPASAGAIRGV